MNDGFIKIGVVIPTYNRSKKLDRCLNSLTNQTYKNFKVYICDDGSTDNTWEVVERYQDVLNIYYIRTENFGGPGKPRNICIANSDTPYIAFLDSDDWWMPEKLKYASDAINRGIEFHYHPLYIVDHRKKNYFPRKTCTWNIKSKKFEDLLGRGNPIPNSSVVVSRRLLNSVGGFSEEKNKISWEDYDLWLRLAKRDCNFTLLNKPLGFYEIWDGNISREYEVKRRILKEIKNEYLSSSTFKNFRSSWYLYSLGSIEKNRKRKNILLLNSINFSISTTISLKALFKIIGIKIASLC